MHMRSISAAALAWLSAAAGVLAQGGRPNQPHGPWNHEIHFLISPDGLTFTETPEPLMRRASVPDIIDLARDMPRGVGAAKGDLCIYTVDASGSHRPNMETISRLVSSDGG